MYQTIHAAADAIRQGKATPLDLLDQCLGRIDRYEEKVRAWVFVDRAGARQQAERLTDELRRGQYRGPLHGIPVGIKDIFDVFDWPTAAGSRLWANSIARKDATVVERLRQAGAVFLGKTVTTQYASFDPPVTRNPWDLSRTPGGSSSGSAAALACGMCLGALGSQTGGSITRPASYCGVAGCKPTYGRVSCAGVVPLAPSMDHPGPMATCVRDLAILLQAIGGGDPSDPMCSFGLVPDFLKNPAASPSPPKLGRIRGLFQERAEAPVLKMMEEAEHMLREHGATIHELAPHAGLSEVIERHRIVMAVEAAAFHQTRLARHPEDYRPKIRALLEEGIACPAPEYARCKEHQQTSLGDLHHYFVKVDALLTPATTSAPPAADSTGDPAFNSPWSYTGFPTVSIPVGWTPDGLPLAIQLVGNPWRESGLLDVAAWCEKALAFERREPPV